MKIIICAVILFSTLFLSAKPTEKQRVDSITQLINQYYFSQGTKAKNLVKELYSIAETVPKNPGILIQAIYWETLIEYSQNLKGPTLIPKIDFLLQIDNSSIQSVDRALLSYSRSLTNMAHGNYPEAFKNGITALEQFTQLDKTEMMVKTLMMLGNICPYIQDYELGEYYYDEAAKIASEENIDFYKIKMNKSMIAFFREDYEKAIEAVSQIIPDLVIIGDTALLTLAHINLGAYYGSAQEQEKAFEYFTKAMELMQNIDNNNLLLVLYQNIGIYYHTYVKDYEQAYQYYVKTKELAIKNENLEKLSSVAYKLSGLFLEMGQPDSTYHYLTEYQDLIHEFLWPKTNDLYQGYTSMIIESSENKLRIAEQEVLLKNKQMTVTVVVAFAIIIVFILLLIITLQKRANMRHKAQLKEIENNELTEKLFQEQKKQKLQSEEINDKLREVTSYSLLLANKNDILNQILKLNNMRTEKRSDGGEIKNQINKLIKSNLNTDNYWNDFVAHFTEVNPTFFKILQKKFPDLTQNELKMCAYIRIGMSAKQIAQMLNLSHSSVNVNRYRLRKKLNLPKNVELDSFIGNL
ncbi:MAG: LuxR C-terminal-related transcriptional regulator [Bacteroidales bacterium]|nr:LuxR C-terminal-related transcriptional regulator [Acholeplasmataceae bacterium]MCK9448347.1 LuxR C-terminal-related transcriptional regulator [Bacteroidales bacterium]